MLSLFHVGHNYWHPIIAMSFSQNNSSEFSPIMPEEFGEHLIRDQRPFLHTESLQILQIHSSMLVVLLFSSPHSSSTGFRSEDRDSNGKRFILCSVAHFCVYFDVCFGLLIWWVCCQKALFSVSSDHRSQCHLKFQSCLTTEFAGVCFWMSEENFPWNPPEQRGDLGDVWFFFFRFLTPRLN